MDSNVRERMDKLKKRLGVTGGDTLTSNEQFVATAATIVGSQVPAVAKTAKEITAFLGKNLQPLGLAGLGAGAAVAIGKYLASKRTGRPFLQSMGIRKKGTAKGKTYEKPQAKKKPTFRSWMKKRRKMGK